MCNNLSYCCPQSFYKFCSSDYLKMKKNFLQSLSKLSKSLSNSTDKLFTKYSPKKQQPWWHFKALHYPPTKSTLDQFKNIFSSDKLNQNDHFKKIKQQVKGLSSKQNQVLFDAYITKLKETTQQSKNIYDQKTTQIKSKLSQTLKQKKFNLVNDETLQLLKKKSSEVNEKLSQTSQSLKDGLEKSKQYINDESLQFLERKSGEISGKLSSTAQSLKEGVYKSRQYIGQKSQKVPGEIERISGKVYDQVKNKVDVKRKIQKSLSYIFWRVALILGIVAFCYGLGTSLPRQIRSILKELYKSDQNTNNEVQSRPKTDNQLNNFGKDQTAK